MSAALTDFKPLEPLELALTCGRDHLEIHSRWLRDPAATLLITYQDYIEILRSYLQTQGCTAYKDTNY